MSSDTTGPRGWPTQWWDLDRISEARRIIVMVQQGREIAGPRLDYLVGEGVLAALRTRTVPVGGEDGWDVAIGSKAGSPASWPVTLTAPAAPAPGAYDIDLVARDDIGPGRLRVRVTVPAPAASE